MAKITAVVLFLAFLCYKTVWADASLYRVSYPLNNDVQKPILTDEGLHLKLIYPELYASYNSGFPHGANDGALWQGRGFNSYLHTGIVFDTPFLTIRLNPEIWFAENAYYDILPNAGALENEYANYWSRIDYPQRFGADTLFGYSLGQSEIRFHAWYLNLGISNAHVWIGPSNQNPIILGNNAAGFPHVDFGTDGIVNTPLGSFEVRMLWGLLDESSFFDSDESNNLRFLTGLTAGYSLPFLSNVTFGFNRYFLSPYETLTVAKAFPLFETFFKYDRITDENPTGEDDVDQMASIILHWRLQEAGFEAYVEWARNDHSGELRDLVLNPEHSRGYTIGFSQQLSFYNLGTMRIRGELTELGQPKNSVIRVSPSYYRHHIITQGYTQRGQLLAAPVGPGGNGQFVSIAFEKDPISAVLFFQRVGIDNDYLYQFLKEWTYYSVQLTLGGNIVYETDWIKTAVGLSYTNHLNRNWGYQNDVPNIQARLSLLYKF